MCIQEIDLLRFQITHNLLTFTLVPVSYSTLHHYYKTPLYEAIKLNLEFYFNIYGIPQVTLSEKESRSIMPDPRSVHNPPPDRINDFQRLGLERITSPTAPVPVFPLWDTDSDTYMIAMIAIAAHGNQISSRELIELMYGVDQEEWPVELLNRHAVMDFIHGHSSTYIIEIAPSEEDDETPP